MVCACACVNRPGADGTVTHACMPEPIFNSLVNGWSFPYQWHVSLCEHTCVHAHTHSHRYSHMKKSGVYVHTYTRCVYMCIDMCLKSSFIY